MGGANLEVFKFGLYMFFPIAIMFKFGDPDWYKLHVEPLRDMFYPPEANNVSTPKTHDELQDEMAKMRAETAERIARRRQAQAEQRSNVDGLVTQGAGQGGSRVMESLMAESERSKWPDWGQPSGRMV